MAGGRRPDADADAIITNFNANEVVGLYQKNDSFKKTTSFYLNGVKLS